MIILISIGLIAHIFLAFICLIMLKDFRKENKEYFKTRQSRVISVILCLLVPEVIVVCLAFSFLAILGVETILFAKQFINEEN